MFKYLKLLIILLIPYAAKANNFVVVANENSFFEPCNSNDNIGNTKVADLAEINIKHEYADDMETLISNGNITVKVDIGDNTPVMLDMEIFEWKRGKWEKTIYSIRRPDFCQVFFDPSEIWYSLAVQIPEKYRQCPPKKGLTFPIDNVKNRVELTDVPIFDLEGQYKAITHFIVGDYSTCLSTVVNVWKN